MCEHLNFVSNADVSRLSDVIGGPITGYAVDLRVNCAECGLPFHFMGLPLGTSSTHATMSVDQLEARLPIAPGELKPLKSLFSQVAVSFARDIQLTAYGTRRVLRALQGKDIAPDPGGDDVQ